MIIKTSHEALTSMLNLMSFVTSCNKSLQEDHKLINFFVKDNRLYGLTTDAQLYCLKPHPFLKYLSLRDFQAFYKLHIPHKGYHFLATYS